MYKTHLKKPTGFYVITFNELCERFSYYGGQTLLVLYLTTQFFLNDNKSYFLYGAYAAFSYALPVLGGVLADRLLGIKQSLIIGGVLLILGNILMAIPKINSFYVGLALTACGTGLYKPNTASLVGKMYSGANAENVGKGFTLFYLGMNIGATVSPFVYGFMKHWGYQYSYVVSAILLFIGWTAFLVRKRHIIQLLETRSNFKKIFLGYFLIIAAIFVANLMLLYPLLLDNFLLIFTAGILIWLMIANFKREKLERNRLLALLIMCFFGMCFFAASLQVGSSINLFIQRNIDRTIFGFDIPTIMFTSLYPLAVIIVAPFITSIWHYLAVHHKEPALPTKLGLSLIFVSMAFVFFALAALTSKLNFHGYFPIIWIILANLALGIGEVCLVPVMLSAASQFAPANLQGTLIGTWYLFIAFGGYLSGYVAKLSSHQADLNPLISSSIYSMAFMKISFIMLIIAGVLFGLTPWIKSLIRN